mmetsp:Transcript_2608/g.6928  ORF Transcript_2608/g.6928 Transcript_2608/m.6928 type:complete len:255 (-) Transcript_2608:54-818(-)
MRALGLFATNKVLPKDERQSYLVAITLQSRENLWLTTLDGIEEVCKIATARERFVREHGETMVLPRILVILRIWVPDGHSQVPLAENFGMRLDQIDSLIGACLEAGFAPEDIIGVSFHCGSGCESVETYLARGAGDGADGAGRHRPETAGRLFVAAIFSSRCWLLNAGHWGWLSRSGRPRRRRGAVCGGGRFCEKGSDCWSLSIPIFHQEEGKEKEGRELSILSCLHHCRLSLRVVSCRVVSHRVLPKCILIVV